MRLLIDQDVYQITIDWLRGRGHDVVTAKELGMQRAADEELLKRAKEMDRLFLTRDKDFGAWVFLRSQETAGVILLRVRPANLSAVHKELERLFKEHREEELGRSFSVVESHQHRIRRLPAHSS